MFSILKKQRRVAMLDTTDFGLDSANEVNQADGGSTKYFACPEIDNKPTSEEIQEAIDRLERKGLIEWSGEYRSARDGTLQKVWRIAKKR